LAIDGSDLDDDGLSDFGYEYWFTSLPPSAYAAWPIADADPDDEPFPAPGIEDAWWHDGALEWSPYGGDPFAQTFLMLYGLRHVHCPHPGDSGQNCFADIDGSGDCIVGLADLARLLGNYGQTSGMTVVDGDLEPYPEGDGDVDLADVAELLRQYGDDCNRSGATP
jgi:hypothetical protein